VRGGGVRRRGRVLRRSRRGGRDLAGHLRRPDVGLGDGGGVMTDLFVEPEAPAATPPPAVLAPDVVQTPWRHYSAASLRWRDHPELEPFMRATYQAHLAASRRRRALAAGLPGDARAPP